MKTLLLLILLIISINSFTQTKDTITINNVEYEAIIDTITHKVRSCEIIETETFFEKLYIGSTMTINYGNYKQELLWDCSEYGKLGIGYDLGNEAWTISAYISIGRLRKRKDPISIIYF